MAPPGTYPIQTAMSERLLGQGPPKPQTPPAPDEWIRRLGTLPLMHQPGERWMYHTASDVLGVRSEEHTSELQSQSNLVCRLLLEKKKKHKAHYRSRFN